jgi:hypothetical protein
VARGEVIPARGMAGLGWIRRWSKGRRRGSSGPVESERGGGIGENFGEDQRRWFGVVGRRQRQATGKKGGSVYFYSTARL